MTGSESEWDKWDFSSPIFEHFFIIGPSSWDPSTAKPELLYSYPQIEEMKDEKLKSEAQGHAEVLCLSLFPQGLSFEKHKLNQQKLMDHYCSINDIKDKAVQIKHTPEVTNFTHCLIFRASPMTRPGLTVPRYLSERRQCCQQKCITVCDFAMCFVSSHPFFDLLHSILEQILELDAISRRAPEELKLVKEAGSAGYDVDPMQRWPVTAWHARDSFLSAVYHMSLPGFGTAIGFQVAERPPYTWTMPAAEDVPMCLSLLGAGPLLSWIGLGDLIKLLSAMLQEDSILVTAKSIGDTSRTVAWLPQLISPFTWRSPISTMIPPEKAEGYLEPAYPMIVGLHSSLLQGIYKECGKRRQDELLAQLEEHMQVMIDLDKKVILFRSGLPPLPNGQKLRRDLAGLFGARDQALELTDNITISIMRFVSCFLKDTIAVPIIHAIERNVDPCTQETQPPQFVKEPFYARFGSQDSDFLNALTNTTLFRVYTDELCKLMTEVPESEQEDELRDSLMTIGRWNIVMRRQIRNAAAIQSFEPPIFSSTRELTDLPTFWGNYV